MIHTYIRTCKNYQIMNLQKPNYINLHQDIAQTPDNQLSIDLMILIIPQHRVTHMPSLQFRTSQVTL